jgi:hypothetical protein
MKDKEGADNFDTLAVGARRMKRLTLRTAFTILVLLAVEMPDAPFHVRVVDQHGRAVSRARVTTDNGVVCYTDAVGRTTFSEWSVMGRDVRFRVDAGAAATPADTTVHTTFGGHAELTIQR